jgi:hypothetical protein
MIGFFHKERRIEGGCLFCRTHLTGPAAVRTMYPGPYGIRRLTLSVVYFCITHNIGIKQSRYRTDIWFKMTNFKEFAALAESEKKRGVPEIWVAA